MEVYLCIMRNTTLIKINASKCRRMIVIAEINILRRYEDKQNIDDKIVRQMTKLHALWFKGKSNDLTSQRLTA